VTASPQIRDMSVSGGQGTDNAEVGGSIPPSPTRGEGIPAGQLPFQCCLTVTFDNRRRPLTTARCGTLVARRAPVVFGR
jgi:hypothetical protein